MYSPAVFTDLYSVASQNNPAFPDLQLKTSCIKTSKDSLCICPRWGQEEVQLDVPQSAEAEDGELIVKEKTNATEKVNEKCSNAYHEVIYGTFINSHDYIGQAVKLVGILKACAAQKDLHRGSKIHDYIRAKGLFDKNIFVGNAVVNMYAKCGALGKAQEAFDELPVQDVVSWNVLIGGYAQHGHGREALLCFEQMELKGVTPTVITVVCIFKACGSIGASDKGQQIHASILRNGFLEVDIMVANALIDMYAKCGLLGKACGVFDELHVLDVISWNALIAGYAQYDDAEEALNCFDQMQLEGFSPNAVTFVCVLKACGGRGAAIKGQEVHVEIVRKGLLEKDLVVGTALVDMYANCGMLMEAQDVFNELPFWDVVSWTALITGYAQHEHGEQALACFELMQLRGFSPNAFTFASILKACGSMGASAKGQEIHAKVLSEGVLERDFVVAYALVDMYAKWGMLWKAQEVFDKVRVHDVISWNALIGGYAQHEHGENALFYFEEMRREGFSPDVVTFAFVLKACGCIGAACDGEELHAEIVTNGLLENDMVAGTALVDMYANCGMLAEAQDVFDRLPARDSIAWNALLEGYAQLGKVEIVFTLLKKMIGEGNEPTFVTFNIVLNACSHRGVLHMGQTCFEMFIKGFGIIPTLEHHSCLIDLFGRTGNLGKAVAVMERMPFLVKPTMWHAFMGACVKWGHRKLGKWAFQHALQLDESDDAAYICMNNIYAATGVEEDLNNWKL